MLVENLLLRMARRIMFAEFNKELAITSAVAMSIIKQAKTLNIIRTASKTVKTQVAKIIPLKLKFSLIVKNFQQPFIFIVHSKLLRTRAKVVYIYYQGFT